MPPREVPFTVSRPFQFGHGSLSDVLARQAIVRQGAISTV